MSAPRGLLKIRNKIQAGLGKIERALWPDYVCRLTPRMQKALAKEKIILADVGAAGGLHPRWQDLRSVLNVYRFEPDARGPLDTPEAGEDPCWPVALGRGREVRTLHLAEFPPASSLYPVNHELLKDFANYPCHEPAGEASLAVHGLDELLAEHQRKAPDFVKIDVEGAELEVLQGAAGALDSSVLGAEVEVGFARRHLNAPGFGEVDSFLQVRGFRLFHLAREHWVRANQVWGLNSNPQLIWADAVYFLDRAHLLKRLRTFHEKEGSRGETLLAKCVAMLLAYGIHDYALEIVEAARKEHLVDAQGARDLEKAIRGSVQSPCRAELGAALVLAFWSLAYAAFWILPPLRKRLAPHYRARMKRRASALLKKYSMSGHAHSALADPF